MCIEAALQAHRDGTGDRRSWCGRVFLALELIAEALDHNDPDHATEIAREALAGAAQGAGRSLKLQLAGSEPLSRDRRAQSLAREIPGGFARYRESSRS